MCLVDLEKAFDQVLREVIRWALRKKGIHDNLIEVVMCLYDGVMEVRVA